MIRIPETDAVNEPRNAEAACAISVPMTAREFERFIDAQCNAMAWPHQVMVAAERALLTLKSMDQPAFAKSEVLQSESAKDLQAFAEAYAEWKR